jgi:hypothetical protein
MQKYTVLFKIVNTILVEIGKSLGIKNNLSSSLVSRGISFPENVSCRKNSSFGYKLVKDFKVFMDGAFSYGKHNLDTFKLNNLLILSRDMLAATKFRISLIQFKSS